MKQLRTKGFTLIDLIIAILVMAVLATIAYPYYVSFLLKSRRADALTALAQDQIMLERCYAQNFSYSKTCNTLPTFPQTSAQGFYSITLTNLGNTTYVLTAKPIGSQNDDITCAKLTVDQANVKTAVDSDGKAQTICWNPT